MSTYLEENKLAESVQQSNQRLRSNTLLAYADNSSVSDIQNTSINSPRII